MNQSPLNFSAHLQDYSVSFQSHKSSIELRNSLSTIPEDRVHILYELNKPQESCSPSINNNSKKIQKVPQLAKKASQDTIASHSDSKNKQRHTWKPDEDAQVLDLVSKYGQKWKKISDIMGRRTAKQIRDRYLHKLRPTIQKNCWTMEEDHLLLILHDKYGSKWSRIVQHMPTRTENQVRNRYNSRLKHGCCDNYKVSPETVSSLDSVSPNARCESDVAIQYSEEEKSSLTSIKYLEKPLMSNIDLIAHDIEDFFASTKEDPERDYSATLTNQLINTFVLCDLDISGPSYLTENHFVNFFS